MNRLQSLTTLHLRDNQLEALDGFVEDLKMLQYINFRWLYMPLMMLQILKQAVLKWDVKYQVWSNNLPFAFRHYPALQIKLLLWRWIYHTLQKIMKRSFFGINCTVFAYLTKGISKVLYLKHAKKVLWYRF